MKSLFENKTFGERKKIIMKILEKELFGQILEKESYPTRPALSFPKEFKNCKIIIIPINEKDIDELRNLK